MFLNLYLKCPEYVLYLKFKITIYDVLKCVHYLKSPCNSDSKPFI